LTVDRNVNKLCAVRKDLKLGEDSSQSKAARAEATANENQLHSDRNVCKLDGEDDEHPRKPAKEKEPKATRGLRNAGAQKSGFF